MLAREIMIPEPFVAAAGATSAEVALLMRGKDISVDRKSTRLNSSHLVISYAVFCLKKKKQCDEATSASYRRLVRIGCISVPHRLFLIFFFFNDTATTEIYTLSLHDALPI